MTASDDPAGPGDLLRLRSSADTDGEVQRVLAKLEASGGDLAVLRSIANSGAAFRPFMLVADALLFRTPLPPRVREVVILFLAVHHRSDYEWNEHVRMSAEAGVGDAQRAAILAGERPPGLFADDELLALAAAAEIVGEGRLSRSRWQAAIEAWGVEGAMDLVLTVGWWGGMVPLVLSALALDAPPMWGSDVSVRPR